jgi:hypothetical protein
LDQKDNKENNPDITLTEIPNIFIMYAEHDMRLQNPLPAAKFIVPDRGDKVDSWHRVVVPARQAT